MVYKNCTLCFAPTLDAVKQQFGTEFQQPKSEQQSITKLKEIRHIVSETPWEYAQRFRDLISRLTFQIQKKDPASRNKTQLYRI